MIAGTIRPMRSATPMRLTCCYVLLMAADIMRRHLFKLAVIVRRRLILAVPAIFLHSAPMIQIVARSLTEGRRQRNRRIMSQTLHTSYYQSHQC